MHLGYSVAAAMWAMTALALGFVALRIYHRVRIVHVLGLEDYLYICTGVLLVAFSASIHVAAYYGLGLSFWILSLDDSSNAILWTYIANTFAVTGNCLAKLSLGFFLLRVVPLRSQKAALWALIFFTAATSIALVIMVWNQTTPVKASWDPLRTPGTWNIQIKPMSVGLGGTTSLSGSGANPLTHSGDGQRGLAFVTSSLPSFRGCLSGLCACPAARRLPLPAA